MAKPARLEGCGSRTLHWPCAENRAGLTSRLAFPTLLCFWRILARGPEKPGSRPVRIPALAMFEALTEKLSEGLRRVRGQHRLTEENIASALQEVRTALLEADVHFRVVRAFLEAVQARA